MMVQIIALVISSFYV